MSSVGKRLPTRDDLAQPTRHHAALPAPVSRARCAAEGYVPPFTAPGRGSAGQQPQWRHAGHTAAAVASQRPGPDALAGWHVCLRAWASGRWL